MSTTTPHSPRPRWLLALGGVLAALGIAILWPLREVGQVCIMIYPAPPGCGAAEPRWASLVGIGLIVVLFCAMVVVTTTVAAPRVALIVLMAGIVAAVVVAVAIVGLSQTGVWDGPQPLPPVIID